MMAVELLAAHDNERLTLRRISSQDAENSSPLRPKFGWRVSVQYELRVEASEADAGTASSDAVGSEQGTAQLISKEQTVVMGNLSPAHWAALQSEYYSNDSLRRVIDAKVEEQSGPASSAASSSTDAAATDLAHPFVFDSAFRRGCAPLEFSVGAGEVLPALDLAVQNMAVGERVLVSASPKWAFGEFGCPPVIPAGSGALVELDVTLVTTCAPVVHAEAPSLLEGDSLAHAEKLRLEGNEHFRAGEYRLALLRYADALRALDQIAAALEAVDEPTADMADLADKVVAAQVPVYVNSSICHLKLAEPARAIRQAELALEIDRQNVKAMWRLGQALLADGEPLLAHQYLLAAARLEPQNRALRKDLEEAKQLVAAQQTTRQTASVFSGMFG